MYAHIYKNAYVGMYMYTGTQPCEKKILENTLSHPLSKKQKMFVTGKYQEDVDKGGKRFE